MIFRRRSMIDETWKTIAEATVAGKLGCSSKVLFCVYHKKYSSTVGAI